MKKEIILIFILLFGILTEGFFLWKNNWDYNSAFRFQIAIKKPFYVLFSKDKVSTDDISAVSFLSREKDIEIYEGKTEEGKWAYKLAMDDFNSTYECENLSSTPKLYCLPLKYVGFDEKKGIAEISKVDRKTIFDFHLSVVGFELLFENQTELNSSEFFSLCQSFSKFVFENPPQSICDTFYAGELTRICSDNLSYYKTIGKMVPKNLADFSCYFTAFSRIQHYWDLR